MTDFLYVYYNSMVSKLEIFVIYVTGKIFHNASVRRLKKSAKNSYFSGKKFGATESDTFADAFSRHE